MKAIIEIRNLIKYKGMGIMNIIRYTKEEVRRKNIDKLSIKASCGVR